MRKIVGDEFYSLYDVNIDNRCCCERRMYQDAIMCVHEYYATNLIVLRSICDGVVYALVYDGDYKCEVSVKLIDIFNIVSVRNSYYFYITPKRGISYREIKPYLPYGLTICSNQDKDAMRSINGKSVGCIVGDNCYSENGYNLILRPLRSIKPDEIIDIAERITRKKPTRTYTYNSNFPNELIISVDFDNISYNLEINTKKQSVKSYYSYKDTIIQLPIPYLVFDWFFQKHFDMFGLIEKGYQFNIK